MTTATRDIPTNLPPIKVEHKQTNLFVIDHLVRPNRATMNTRMPSLLIAITAVALSVCSLFAAETPKITAATTELTASDLASALGVRSWSYRLRFDKPVAGATVQLCELRRQPDGSWQRTYLASYGFHEEGSAHREIPVTVLIHDQPAGEFDFGLRLGGDFTRSKLTQRPDFSRMYSRPQAVRFISGCLVLAVEERDPRISTGQETNMVRIIGLEIETK
jgi:hypothetical protein